MDYIQQAPTVYHLNFTEPPFGAGGGGYMNMQPGGGPPQIAPAPPVDIMEEEPPSKKMRSEDNLIPEAEFIATHKVGWLQVIQI